MADLRVAEVLDHAEAVLRDDEVDLSDVDSPQKAKTAQLELIAHLRDQLCADAMPAEVPAWVVVAYLWDRREQYKPSSGTYESISQIIAGLCRGDHVEAWKHGELDDLRQDVERCMTNEATLRVAEESSR